MISRILFTLRSLDLSMFILACESVGYYSPTAKSDKDEGKSSLHIERFVGDNSQIIIYCVRLSLSWYKLILIVIILLGNYSIRVG